MKIDTKYFGEIEIDDGKIIHFENGIMGFEEYKDFTLLYDSEAEKKPFFSWLQCVTEKSLAFPVVNPLNVINFFILYIGNSPPYFRLCRKITYLILLHLFHPLMLFYFHPVSAYKFPSYI